MKTKESKIFKETSTRLHNLLASIRISTMLVPAKNMKIFKRREKRLGQMVARLTNTY